MKWNGRTYRPANAYFIKKKKDFDFEEALKPLGQKEMPVWNPVIGVNNSPEQPSPTPSVTPSNTPSITPTNTPSITPTSTPGATPTATPSNTPSITPSITSSPTPTNTASNTPTNTPSNTPSTTPSNTPSITPTNTPSITPSNTPSITPTNTPSTTPSNTPSITPSITPSNTPSNTPSITPTNTPTPSTSPLPSGTTEARAYLTAVVNAGGTLSSTISAATETLFTSIVSAGLWDKMTQFYPLLGGTGASCAIEGKSATSKITWNGGMTFGSLGAAGNGTNAYGNVAYNENTLSTLNNFHQSFYSNSNVRSDGLFLGVTDGTNRTSMYGWDFSAPSAQAGNVVQASGAYAAFNNLSSLAFYIGNRTASNAQNIYANGTLRASNTTASTSKVNGNFYVFARNNTSSGSADAFRNARCAFFSLGLSLSATDVTNLQNAVHTFNTTLGRNY